MRKTKIVSRTVGILSTDTAFIDGQEAVLFGRNDRSIAHISPDGTITQFGIGIIIDDVVQAAMDSSITTFIKRYNTIRRVSQAVANAAGAPGNTASGGVLGTIRMQDDNFSYQEWRRSMETTVYRRVWLTASSTWGAWSGYTGTTTYNGDGVSTSKTIAHGLSSTPTYYNVEEASAAAGTAEISYVTADATNLTVNFKTAPASGTNNVKLVWKAEQ